MREPAPVAYKTYDTGRDITIWKSLYFGHAGVVDISSSHILEKAFVREGESILRVHSATRSIPSRIPKKSMTPIETGSSTGKPSFSLECKNKHV